MKTMKIKGKHLNISSHKVGFNKEIESLKKTQNEIKLEIKNLRMSNKNRRYKFHQ